MPKTQNGEHVVPAKGIAVQRTARIAGAAYLIQYATSVYAIYVRSSLAVSSGAAQSASNIIAHAQLFRASILADVFTCACLVVLNVAFYELLSPVHLRVARMAAVWRIVEIAIGGAIAVSSLVAVSLLTSNAYAAGFQQRELQGLAHAFIQAQASGYMVALFFSGLGSTAYMYLLLRSGYVPRAIAVLAVTGSMFIIFIAVVPLAFPALPAMILPLVVTLPVVLKLLVALVLVPIIGFEAILGAWFLVKGVGPLRRYVFPDSAAPAMV